MGPRGDTGATGSEGSMGMGGGWSWYRGYTFSSNSNVILSSDRNKAREIAHYLDENPSFTVGIDGSNRNNVDSVRTALIDAGIPAYKIRTGSFGDPQLRRNDHVAVLLTR
jgi:hypothetical protein